MHAMVDITADAVSYIAVTSRTWKLYRCRFPFGTGRIETFASLVIALMLCSGAATILFGSCTRLYEKVMGIEEKEEHTCTSSSCGHGHSHGHIDLDVLTDGSTSRWVGAAMVGVAVSSLFVKELLFRFGKRIGEAAGSRVVVANAYHHRADAWASGAALLGVLGTLGGVPVVDSVAAVAVSSSVLNVGLRLLTMNMSELLSYQPTEYEERGANVNRLVIVGGGGPEGTEGGKKALLVNVGVLRHGHSMHITGTLITEPSATAADIALAAKMLKERFEAEFHCCCPQIRLLYRVLVVLPPPAPVQPAKWIAQLEASKRLEINRDLADDEDGDAGNHDGSTAVVDPVVAIKAVMRFHEMTPHDILGDCTTGGHGHSHGHGGHCTRSTCQQDIEALKAFLGMLQPAAKSAA